jgi:phenylacetate-CoA oxygenase PaaH subunit
VGAEGRPRRSCVIYEVFRQEREGQPFQHGGSLEAPDLRFAEIYAREFYARRNESLALWLVPRSAVREIEDLADELDRDYRRVDGYSLKVKLKEARERAGPAPARG